MEKRELGKSGLVTSKMGFGCMGLNYHRGVAKDRNEMIKVVREAIDVGITMFDTAAVYGPYTNEELVGDALVGYRDKVQIALAWVMAQKPWIVPIPGTTKISRIHENIKAANIKFSDEEMKTINDALSKIEIVGDRYPESEKRRTGN